MAALDVWFQDDLRGAIVAGVVLAVESAGMGNIEYLRGVAALAKHQAAIFGISWPAVIADCRAALGADFGELIEAASGSLLTHTM